MRLVVMLAEVALAGCVQTGLATIAQTDTAITLRLSRATLLAPAVALQEAEDAAQAHCRRRGLVPRLASDRAGPDYTYLRYECMERPG